MIAGGRIAFSSNCDSALSPEQALLQRHIEAAQASTTFRSLHPVLYRGFSQDGLDGYEIAKFLSGDRRFEPRSRVYSRILSDSLKAGTSYEEALKPGAPYNLAIAKTVVEHPDIGEAIDAFIEPSPRP